MLEYTSIRYFQLGHLGELCGLMPDCEQTSEQLHTVVSLSAGIGDPSHLHQSNSVSPIYQLKDALLSKDAFSKHYLVSKIIKYCITCFDTLQIVQLCSAASLGAL